jgi:hypothetical protein
MTPSIPARPDVPANWPKKWSRRRWIVIVVLFVSVFVIPVVPALVLWLWSGIVGG